MPENTPQRGADGSTPQPYTPTPWYRNISPAWKYPIYAGDNGDWTYVGSVTAPGSRNRNLTDEACEGNLNLIIASVNSYARHCGPNAIQCAEDDLLGDAVDVLQDLTILADNVGSDGFDRMLRNLDVRANEVLSRLSAEQGVES